MVEKMSTMKNPSMLSNQEREKRMWTKIRAGESIETIDDMSDDYIRNLTNLMLQQADSELACAFGCVPWIIKAPTIEKKLIVADTVKDSLQRADSVYRLLENLGIDIKSYIAKHDYAYRVTLKDDSLKLNRITDDKRLNIFYYSIDTWADFVAFLFCVYRGARRQLEDARKSTYGPWKREIERVFRDESTRVDHSEYWVKEMALERATKGEIQEAFNRWYSRTMNIFGKPNTHQNEIYRQYGLKFRDNDDVRKVFVKEMMLKCNEWGLSLPVWQPVWAKAEKNSEGSVL
jgi:ring-1,2-phenylacetyl-CoA epoxidase subunit PaaA